MKLWAKTKKGKKKVMFLYNYGAMGSSCCKKKKMGINKILIKRESLESVIKILKRLGVWMLPEREGKPRRFSNQECDTRLFFKKLALRHPTKNEDGPYISSKVGLHFFKIISLKSIWWLIEAYLINIQELLQIYASSTIKYEDNFNRLLLHTI